MADELTSEQIRVRGLVQGVGFRPTVWQIAKACGLTGRVWNDAWGVQIEVWGGDAQIDEFVQRLQTEAPPLASIEALERLRVDAGDPPEDFTIVPSRSGEVRTGVVADAATCQTCLADVFDPNNRRYRYPFTNCTHCGPRLSIIRSIPYDRASTSMSVFPQCGACQAEYDDPADRRYHAQPNACGDCGPRIWLEDVEGNPVDFAGEVDAIARAASLIKQGDIVAIKGIGGVHLACDASNSATVERLRQRKRRYHKAFALMARDVGMIREYVHLNALQESALSSPAAPIVVLERHGRGRLASAVAPGQNTLGFMLPYTPLHHLLMQGLEHPIVLTSGNCSDEPQCIDNAESHQRLGAIADYWLLHDREIVNRLDDSVVRVLAGKLRLLRRARGYAPAPLTLPEGFEAAPPVLAFGAELKNTFCLLQDGKAILSQHMGDLENSATYADYRHNLALYQNLYQHQPRVLAVDMHPNYLSTQWGRRRAEAESLQLEEVQHHHAHIAACMAEHGIPLDAPPVLGIALDGLGFGEDGAIWGGEFIKADYLGFERLASFQPAAMIGGARAMYEPWRNTYAHLRLALDWRQISDRYAGLELIRFLRDKPLANIDTMLERGLNSPTASSCGRLFDAVAAALGLCREGVSHEGQAAIELEALVDLAEFEQDISGYGYRLMSHQGLLQLNWRPLWEAILSDLDEGVTDGVIAARFHAGVARAVAETGIALCRQYHLGKVVLSGGVFQNRLLLERVFELLQKTGLTVLAPEQTPSNDGGVSLGQAVVAAARRILTPPA